MTALPVITPRRRGAGGCTPAHPRVARARATALAAVAKAIADPTRLQIVDAIRESAPHAVCQCDLLPLFDMAQPTLARHLKVLITAGVLAAERRGTWTYYYERPEALEGLTSWLT
ncbi:MAG: ArsR/SmtB family transcription factor [Baekduiaceae bacterium]